MRLERLLPVGALVLMAVWSAAVTVAVLTDGQLTVDIAAGVVVATVLLPVFLAACLLGLLVWPMIRLMDDVDPAGGDGAILSER